MAACNIFLIFMCATGLAMQSTKSFSNTDIHNLCTTTIKKNVKQPSTNDSTQSKIDDFWKSTRQQLDKIPIDADVVKVKEALPYQKYKVTLTSLGSVRICAYLSIPVQGESKPGLWPVIVTTPGYSGNQQGVMLSECQRGYAILQVFPRGQGESAEFYKITGDKLAGSSDQPEGAYYQGAYADVMRMIDFVLTRSDFDPNRIALVGTSQGGGISLAVAALDKRVKAVVVHLPFLCNIRLAATIPSLAKHCLDLSGKNTDTALNILDYFDVWQLAPKLNLPVLMSAGGKDEICPMATIQSVYERLPGKKSLKIYKDLIHTSCIDFYNISWPWLDKNFRNKRL